jgi:hypothetical protein
MNLAITVAATIAVIGASFPIKGFSTGHVLIDMTFLSMVSRVNRRVIF